MVTFFLLLSSRGMCRVGLAGQQTTALWLPGKPESSGPCVPGAPDPLSTCSRQPAADLITGRGKDSSGACSPPRLSLPQPPHKTASTMLSSFLQILPAQPVISNSLCTQVHDLIYGALAACQRHVFPSTFNNGIPFGHLTLCLS